MTKNRNISLLMVAFIMLATPFARAVRPFITDDAALIGFKRSELATWTLFNNSGAEFWHSYNIGISNRIEISLAGFWGYSNPKDGERKAFSFTAPLIQGKFLFRNHEPNGWPGIIIAAGSDLPFGKGAFVPGGYGAFSFLAITQCFGADEDVLIHVNAGGSAYIREGKNNHGSLTYGIGTQIKAYKGLHGIAEIVSGDPYVYGVGMVYQLGIRHFVSDLLQLDIAYGKGFRGDDSMSSWITGGIRYVVSYDKTNRNRFTRNGRKL